MSNHSRFIALAIACLLCPLSGCEGPTTATNDAKADSKPVAKLSLKESLAKATGLATKISEGFASGDAEKAHDPLHEIGHLLENLPKTIADSKLASETKSALGTAVEDLMDAFGQVDAKLHDMEKGADFADVKEKIDAALKSIEQMMPTLK